MKSEKGLQNACMTFARGEGGYARKIEATSHRGFPDCLFITPAGRVFFVEFKAPGGTGRVMAGQTREIALLRFYNVEVHILDRFDDFCAIYKENANER
jgi:hypothetical protein